MTQDVRDLIAEAKEALARINIHAFPDDLAFQYRGGVLGRNITEILRDVISALEVSLGERDAAVAAVERVREVVDDWASDEDAKGLHFDLRAALDGVPEPEWEYGVVGVHGQVINNGDYEVEQTHRRRKAGPWLPVEGEKP